MDKNGKLFGKINIVDFCVVLVVILFAAGIGVRFLSRASEYVKTPKTYEYTVSVSGVREFTVQALEKMGNITDEDGNMVVGEIVSVERVPYEVQVVTVDGEVKETVMPERLKCNVTIRAEGKESNECYFTKDDVEISVGRTVEVISKYVNTSGVISSVEVIG